MANPLQYVSVYHCRVCTEHIGIFFAWDELEEEKEPVCCSVCGNEDGNKIDHIKDTELTPA